MRLLDIPPTFATVFAKCGNATIAEAAPQTMRGLVGRAVNGQSTEQNANSL
jgi:hypothetical protein